jgi:hypothetical protein
VLDVQAEAEEATAALVANAERTAETQRTEAEGAAGQNDEGYF